MDHSRNNIPPLPIPLVATSATIIPKAKTPPIKSAPVTLTVIRIPAGKYSPPK